MVKEDDHSYETGDAKGYTHARLKHLEEQLTYWRAESDRWQERYHTLLEESSVDEEDGLPSNWAAEAVVKYPDLAGMDVGRACDLFFYRSLATPMDEDNPGWREEFAQSDDPIKMNVTTVACEIEISQALLDDVPRMPTYVEALALVGDDHILGGVDVSEYEDWIDHGGEG